MAGSGSVLASAPAEQPTESRKRTLTIVLLCGMILFGEYLHLSDFGFDRLGAWIVDLYFPLCPLLAGLKCLHTAVALTGRERRAWSFFALACLCMFGAEAIWGYYVAFITDDPPVPSVADVLYILSSVCFVIGILYYQDRSRIEGVSLVQAGNLGIVFSSIVFAFVLALYQVIENVALSPVVTSVTLVEGILLLAAPVLGLIMVSLRSWGRKREIMGFILIGLSCIAIEFFGYIYDLINGLYTENNPLGGLYFVASATWFFAATEQDRLGPHTNDPEAAAALEDRAKQWETLIPTFAVAGVFVVGFVFRDSLSDEMLPYLSASVLVFVVSLGVRNWWGQKVETRLQAETLASEALLRTANRDLRQAIKNRARAEDELRQSQKMEALGQLTGGVAHDFNNLLSVIQANLDLVGLSGDSAEERADRLASAMSAVQQGASLTQYLLALSRKQALNPQPIDVEQLLSQARSGLERTLGKSIKVKINVRDDLWHCLADRAQLESAVLNLALNARDAMPGGGEVRIDASNAVIDEEYKAVHPDAELGDYLMISVRDTGIGIPKECLGKVWEPFFTTKKRGEATGLGLSTVYGFLKQLGGHVEIFSEVGVGTEVRLYLPKTSAPVRSLEIEDVEDTPMGAGEILLLVEDDSKLRELLTTLLDGLGYNVVNAADGPEALSIFDELPDVRLVLSDVMLTGGTSGVELVNEIRLRRPEVKVLLMSGYAAKEIEKAGHRRGEVELLTKPFTQRVVARKIRAVLEESGE